MVCNIFKILDENEIKQLSMIDYNMKQPTYKDYCFKVINSWKRTITITRLNDELDEIEEIIHNDNFIEPQGFMLKFKEKYFDGYKLKNEYMVFDYGNDVETTFQKHFTLQKLLDYLGIIPFTPSVMINISPDWASGDRRKIDCKIKILQSIINSYMAEQWYDKWEYVIENGSDGTHIHAHIVAHMNVKRLKSVESHLRRGNHTQQLKKYAKKIKGMEGIIKGNSVQKIFLRTEEIVNDKLLYLKEEHKPEGHKNQSVIKDGYVCGCL